MDRHALVRALAVWALCWLALPASRAPAQVLTSQMNAGRTGADTTETLLTPRNVNAREFGHRFRIPADGDVYAEPLVLPQVHLADWRVREIVYIATEHGSVDS